eukprot:1992480-Rhodomonas_salina.5
MWLQSAIWRDCAMTASRYCGLVCSGAMQRPDRALRAEAPRGTPDPTGLLCSWRGRATPLRAPPGPAPSSPTHGGPAGLVPFMLTVVPGMETMLTSQDVVCVAAVQREGGAVRESKVPEWVPLVSDGKSALSAQ